jgi:hypothetical protein
MAAECHILKGWFANKGVVVEDSKITSLGYTTSCGNKFLDFVHYTFDDQK